MNWRYKAVLQNLIARLPMSDAVYYTLQRTAGDLRPGHFDPSEWVIAGGHMLQWLTEAGFRMEGKRLLEIGTGRAIGIPAVFWLCGAAQTVSVDLNRYLSPTLVKEFVTYVSRNTAKIQETLRPHDCDGKLAERLQRLCSFTGDAGSFLRMTNVDYHAPADATNLPFPEHSFDLHFSYSVFEHVPPKELTAILREARRVLRPHGLLLHTFDLSDHFSYGDGSITRINCLQYSEKQWRRWAGNKYMYHNRLRASEFRQLFAQAGLRLRRESRTLDQRSLDTLTSGFPLHARFAAFQREDLAVTAMQILGDFSEVSHSDEKAAVADCMLEWIYLR